MMMRAAAAGFRTASNYSKKTPSAEIAVRTWRHQRDYQGTAASASQFLHTVAGGPWEDRRRRQQQQHQKQQIQLYAISHVRSLSSPQMQQVAHYRSTPQSEKVVAIMLGLGAVSALSYAGASALRAYYEYKATLPSEEEMEQMRKQQEKESSEQQQQQQQEAQANAKSSSSSEESGKRENIFATFFGVGVGAKYYEGGFEETMTRREAALILGVRESSPASRIKDAHRKLLVLNHPDTGGSTYVAGKINEAKELLLKGKRGK